jgi:hypothetical protein
MLWKSGGGLRFVNNKINGKSSGSAWFQHGLVMDMDPSVMTGVLVVANNSIENFTGYGVAMTEEATATFFNSIMITGNEISGLDASASSTGIFLDEGVSGVTITGNHIYTVRYGIDLERVKHAIVSGNSLTNIAANGIGIRVRNFTKNVVIGQNTIDMIAGGLDVQFDKPTAIADPCYEKVIPFGGANGSNMPVIGDGTARDQVEIGLITGYNTVIIEIEATGVVAGNGAWASKQARLVAATNGGTATIATIGTDYAYQGTGAVITQTAGTSKVTFGVQKLLGTDLSGHLRIKVRGAGLSSFKQLNRYN